MAYVQSANTTLVPSGGVATTTVTLTSVSTVNNRLYLLAQGFVSALALSVSSISDNADAGTNTWVKLTGPNQQTDGTSPTDMEVWTCNLNRVRAAGGLTITITWNQNFITNLDGIGMCVAEYSGHSTVNDATCVDVSATGKNVQTPPVSGSSGATAASGTANSIPMGFASDDGANLAPNTTGSSVAFTTHANSLHNDATADLMIADAAAVAAGTAVTFKNGNTGDGWVAACILIKPAGAAAAVPPPLFVRARRIPAALRRSQPNQTLTTAPTPAVPPTQPARNSLRPVAMLLFRRRAAPVPLAQGPQAPAYVTPPRRWERRIVALRRSAPQLGGWLVQGPQAPSWVTPRQIYRRMPPLARRFRVADLPEPQGPLAPAYSSALARSLRRLLQVRRAAPQPPLPPAAAVSLPSLQLSRRARTYLFRRRPADGPWAQGPQAPPYNPPSPRAWRRQLWLRRSGQATIPAAPAVVPPPLSPPRRRLLPPLLRRGRLADGPWPQGPLAPAWTPSPPRLQRRLLQVRRAITQPVPVAVITVLPPPGQMTYRRRVLWLRRAQQVPMPLGQSQLAPVYPVGFRRSVARWVLARQRSGRSFEPPWPQGAQAGTSARLENMGVIRSW